MNKDIAEKWVAALRSGQYKQARGTLRDTEQSGATGFCCLGVLCDISKQGEWNQDDRDTWNYVLRADFSETQLPDFVLEWAGMAHREGMLPRGETLTNLNDSGKSFDQIADIIEKYWNEL
jgi:hypothetical protein